MGADEAGGGVVVLGGTSLVGRFLLPRLAEAGIAATVLSRGPPASSLQGLTWVQGDIGDPDLEARLPRATQIYALTPIWLLARALPALMANGAERIVAFSSTSRFTKLQSTDAYERGVAERLAASEDALIASGARWTILRPTLIYAEGQDANVSRLARLIARFGVLPLAGQGGGRRQPVHADDLAQAALAAMRSDSAVDRAYELPGGETLTYRDMAARVFEALGKRPCIVPIPPALWRIGLTLASPLLPGATAAMGTRMAEDLTFDSSAAARDFGWSPRAFRPDFTGKL